MCDAGQLVQAAPASKDQAKLGNSIPRKLEKAAAIQAGCLKAKFLA
jgi:hypothetical protein